MHKVVTPPTTGVAQNGESSLAETNVLTCYNDANLSYRHILYPYHSSAFASYWMGFHCPPASKCLYTMA